MISLITLEEAKAQVRRDDALDDTKIAQAILGASAIVLNHIKITVPAEDSPDTRISQMFGQDTVPEDVKVAVLLVTAELYENRESKNADPISSSVEAVLCGWRDPTVA